MIKQEDLNNFIDGVINRNLEPKVNDIIVGIISNNIKEYLKNKNIYFDNSSIKLTYRKIDHSIRDNKNPKQKVTIEQIKQVYNIIKQNNVYYDVKKKNIIYVASLPQDEIIDGRNWIKVPVNIAYKKNKENIIGTISRISSTSIINATKEYKK